MFLMYFTEQPMSAYPEEEARKAGGVSALVLSNRFFDPAEGIASIMSGLTEVSLVGVETVGDVATYRMKGKLPSQSLAPLLGTVAPDLMVDTEVWIGVEDTYLYQVVFRGRVTPEDADDIKRTIELSNFNRPVTIEPPRLE